MDHKENSIQKHKKDPIQEHKKNGGKMEISSKVPLKTKKDLSTYYTPGVAKISKEIAEKAEKAYQYTWKKNNVAVVSDGSATLGLGKTGGLASLPVMEGKAILFKKFGNVDGIPVILESQDPDKTIETVANIAPGFGGINLEDIKAPECFYIEQRLKEKLNIPVFHDDQHGTAIVTLAGIINSLKLADKKIQDTKTVISGAGAAGIAIAKLLRSYGAKNIIITDSKGVITRDRNDLNEYKQEVAEYNIHNAHGDLRENLKGADIFVGVSQPDLIGKEDVMKMNTKPIIFALSNPDPEIRPSEAKRGGAFIIGTGRSDYPNQVNNLLAFPGIFRGALDGRIPNIEEKHKITAAEALADYIQKPQKSRILPSPLDGKVAHHISEAMKKC